MRLAVVGTGYVGLVTGTCFAELGHNVTCLDINAEKIAALKRAEIPIYEPGLEVLIKTNTEQGRLHFSTDTASAVQSAEVIFIAVGTPSKADGSANLDFVFDVARSIGRHMNGDKVIVDKSTVPVGTSVQVAEIIRGELMMRKVAYDFEVVSNPEFLREGSAIQDYMEPDRIVIGCRGEKARKCMGELYQHFAQEGHPVLYMTQESAELTKYAANAMLATKISFINAVACLCQKSGADINEVREGIGSDSRIGYQFISPGIGYGGSCFPKDVDALIGTAHGLGVAADLLEAVQAVNQRQKQFLVEQVCTYFDGALAGKKIAVWGLAFKPETDDVREAPSLEIVRALLSHGAEVIAFDPKATEQAKTALGKQDKLTYADDYYTALSGADALVICTEWPFFLNPDFARMKQLMKTPAIFDGRNIYTQSAMLEKGFDYISVGRAAVYGKLRD